MAKWFGIVGYATTTEVEPGVWVNDIIEHKYYGEQTRNTSKFQTSSGVNDNVTVSNEISIVADPYAKNHFSNIRYVEFMGVKWKVTNVEVKRPRLILTIGGVWNGEQA